MGNRPPVRESFLPFHRPAVGEAEVEAVAEVLRSGWLTTGERARRFAEAFAAELGGGIGALAVSSCTAALHLALKVLGIGPGDEVLVPTTTFAATANVVEHVGARVVFCDIHPETLCIDPNDVERRATPATRAIIPVHLAGYPCDMGRLSALAEARGWRVIEDAAHAIETEHGGRRAGTIGDAGAFSFYATKALTTGEGGMLTLADPDQLERARALSLHGLSADAWGRYGAGGRLTYEVLAPGYKYNLPDVLAAVGLVQLGRLEALYAKRRQAVERYALALAGQPLEWQALDPPDGRHAHHLFVVWLARGDQAQRDRLAAALGDRQIGTSLHFVPLHLQPYYRERYQHALGDFPVAESIFQRTLSLPLYPDMTVADIDYVASHLADLLGHCD